MCISAILFSILLFIIDELNGPESSSGTAEIISIRIKLSKVNINDIKKGKKILDHISKFDIGQSIIINKGTRAGVLKGMPITKDNYLIGRVVGFDGQIKWDHSKPDGTPRKNLDVKRLNNIGWVSKIKLENGLKTTFEEFKKKYDNNTIRSF